MSAYDKFLAEIRVMQASLDRMADLLTLIAPRGNASRLTAEEMKGIRRTMDEAPIPHDLQVWSCGHGHATRDEAAACLQEQRRAAAAKPLGGVVTKIEAGGPGEFSLQEQRRADALSAAAQQLPR